MRRDIDRKSHAGPGLAARMFVDALRSTRRSIERNSFDRHGFTAPAPRRQQDWNRLGSFPALVAAVHMRATNPARVPPDRRRRVNHLKLVAVLKHSDVFAWHNGDDSKGRTVRFPAFAAAAGVVVGDIAFDADLDRPVLAFADQGSAGEVARTLLYSVVNRWVDMNSHGPILLV